MIVTVKENYDVLVSSGFFVLEKRTVNVYTPAVEAEDELGSKTIDA